MRGCQLQIKFINWASFVFFYYSTKFVQNLYKDHIRLPEKFILFITLDICLQKIWCECINIIFDILKDPIIFHRGCLIKIICHDNINTTNFYFFECVFMDLNLLSITLNIISPTSDISSMTTSYNCSYWHVILFNEFHDKFGNLDKDCWTCMFNVECIVKVSILKATLPIDAISIALIFVKSKDISLSYNHNNPRIMNFNVKVLPVLTPLVKNKHISVSRYNYFYA